MTGLEPYEELLKDVKCPNYLAIKLHKLWNNKDILNQYYIITEVINSLDVTSDNILDDINNDSKNGKDKYPGMILYHTLYRYLVLFGIPNDFIINTNSNHSNQMNNNNNSNNSSNNQLCPCADNPVWSVIMESLGIDGKISRNMNKDECIKRYHTDHSLWSIHNGNHSHMVE